MSVNLSLWISSSIVLDVRKAVWFPKESTLAIADLRIGAPQEAATSAPGDETIARLLALAADYEPHQILFTGQTLHPEATAASAATRFPALLTALRERTGVLFLADEPGPILGNLLEECDWHEGLRRSWQCGRHHFLNHRDLPDPPLVSTKEESAFALVASEFPAETLGQTAPVQCPSFVLSRSRILLPSFASDPPLRTRHEWLYPLPDEPPWEKAIVIAAGKLLIRPLPRP